MTGQARAHRRAAILALYQLDAGRQDDIESIRDGLIGADLKGDSLNQGLAEAQAVWAQVESIDARIESLSTEWPVHRQPAVDRAILRLATWELQSEDTPTAVVLDEAVMLANEFGTERSSVFINAVLDAVAHKRGPDAPAEA
ncbi:MAG: transcription antitermination factor NusB [Phycisphaerales bacterium]|nr:transcription antitermination factor NusB [Phycisphaerales bacterium]